MTLYLDTSSLVKLYVAESGSDTVRQIVAARSAARNGPAGPPVNGLLEAGADAGEAGPPDR